MSVPQFIRKASLIVGGDDGNAIDLSALRFAFSIRRGDIQTPNSADIRVYNVAPQTAERIRQILPTPEFTRVVIQAGYDGNYGVIFDGQIKQVRRGRESQLDTYLDITAADGDSAYNFAVSAVSLAAGSKPSDHIAAVLEGMAKFGVSQGSWSIQDGKVNFIPLTAYMPGDVPVITAATGMVGLPEQTQDGIKIKCLLNPNIKIGTQVKLDNASIQRYRYNHSINQQAQNAMSEQSNKINDDGFYYVMIADHQGDTRGNAWFTELICLAVDATVPISYTQRQGVNNSVGPIKRYG